MQAIDYRAFDSVFREAYHKCFGQPLQVPLTESQSKLFANEILEKTGLVIGWKSIKNYSFFLLHPHSGRQENPAVATLDTLARFVLDVAKTDEAQRKKNESHYPFWYSYKERFVLPHEERTLPQKKTSIRSGAILLGLGAICLLATVVFISIRHTRPELEHFADDFATVSEEALYNRGWRIESRDPVYWKTNNHKPGHLTLYTLEGDNWPDSSRKAKINNLLLKEITTNCFILETHLSDFIPTQNWQQAGIILMEDSTFTGKSIRLSLAYNDYTGGYPKSREILIQTITSLGTSFNKPEEIAHLSLFKLGAANTDPIIAQNLHHFAFRIEKKQDRFRFLYASGAMKNSAFKEIVSHEFSFKPKYVGLFAIKGFVGGQHNIIPVYIDYFSLLEETCNEE